MTTSKMHDNEVETDASLVGRLLAAQFPQWAHLPIVRVHSAGTDNALYRLGNDLVVRLPRIDWAIAQVEKEQQWLPRLAPFLPLAIPLPLAHGKPGEGYPWDWSVYRWLAGKTASIEHIADPRQAALDLAQFIAALQQIDATHGPPPGSHNAFRGEPLALRDVETRAAIATLQDTFAADAMTAVWDAAINAAAWHGSPVWLHGDLHAGNLLAVEGGSVLSSISAAWVWAIQPAM